MLEHKPLNLIEPLSPWVLVRNLRRVFQACRRLPLMVKLSLLAFSFIFYYSVLSGLLFAARAIQDSNAFLAQDPFPTRTLPGAIPKLIHQLSPPKLPKRSSASQWISLHPAFLHKLWTDADIEALIRASYPWLLHRWTHTRSGIQKADLGRYVVLYHEGGFYADLDCFPLLPVDPLCDHDLVILEGTDPGGVTNWFIGASKGSPFLGFLLADISRGMRWSALPYLDVMISSGVVKFTEAFHHWAEQGRNVSHVKILYNDDKSVGQNMYVQHQSHQGGRSWHQLDGVLISWFGDHMELVRHVVVQLVGVAVGWLLVGTYNLCLFGSMYCLYANISFFYQLPQATGLVL